MSEDFAAQLAGLQPGSLLAGYRLEARVGAGGMAVVFRARDERLGRLVALKVLAPGLAADPGFRRRFIAESRAAAAVDDPHIIPIYEAGEVGGALFIAMRFVGGGDLRGILNREGALPPRRAAQFVSPVASALDAAHAAGLVHRDVKPANILVDARPDRPDHVYLSDFGVSKGAISSVSLTETGHFLGTPDYSAPEQIRGLAVDGRADQYALACVAYQLLTGVPPFRRDQAMAVLFAHLSEPVPSLGSRRPGLPAAADAVLARGMAKVPEKRFESCADFADTLREALGLAPYTSLEPVPTPDHLPTVISTSRSIATPPWPAMPYETPTADLVPDRARVVARTGPGHARSRARSGSPWRRRLAPLAAAAAVVVVAATVLLTVGPLKPGSGTSATDKGQKLVYAEGGRVPPYYVWISSQGNSVFSPSFADVRLTATGAVIGTVTASAPGNTVVAVVGAADDRTFVLEEQPFANQDNNPGANQYFEPRTFYLLHLSADGRPAGVTRLSITEPAGAGANGLALSPDGTKLAIALQPDNVKREPDLTELQLYSVATGALLRTWDANGTIGDSGQDSEALSWTFDQRTLGFLWLGNGGGERLLDLTKGGSNLIANSRLALSDSGSSPLMCQEDEIVTSNGSDIVCGAGNTSSSAYEEFSTVTGKPAQALAEWPSSGQTEVLWSNPSGTVLVGTAPGSGDVGMITAGTFTTFRGPVTSQEEDQGAW